MTQKKEPNRHFNSIIDWIRSLFSGNHKSNPVMIDTGGLTAILRESRQVPVKRLKPGFKKIPGQVCDTVGSGQEAFHSSVWEA